MTDWFKRINAFISPDALSEETSSLEMLGAKSNPTHSASIHSPNRPLFDHPTLSSTKTSTKAIKNPMISATLNNHEEKDKTMSSKTDNEENLKALKKLRALPRGTQVESRIAAIENLLGHQEVFKTLKMLRWPQGVICPHCHSTNVIRRDPPKDASDARQHYICLNCQEDGEPSDFDDFSGLPISSVHALRQWILCWYLLGFCSISQIAKALGLSIAEVSQMAKQGSELTEIPRVEEAIKSKQEYQIKEKKARNEALNSADLQEDKQRSYSKSPTKPGPKSKL